MLVAFAISWTPCSHVSYTEVGLFYFIRHDMTSSLSSSPNLHHCVRVSLDLRNDAIISHPLTVNIRRTLCFWI